MLFSFRIDAFLKTQKIIMSRTHKIAITPSYISAGPSKYSCQQDVQIRAEMLLDSL